MPSYNGRKTCVRQTLPARMQQCWLGASRELAEPHSCLLVLAVLELQTWRHSNVETY